MARTPRSAKSPAKSNDRITANLPSRDFDRTVAFYDELGFDVTYRDEGWLILSRGPLVLEFFPHPALEPTQSWFSACIRVGDLDRLHADFTTADLPIDSTSIPRIGAPEVHAGVPRMFFLVDCDGNLLRCIDNRSR